MARTRSSGSRSTTYSSRSTVPLTSSSSRSTQSGLTDALSAMDVDDSHLPGAYGPANWVDPVTYRQLKAKFSKKRKATTTKRKKSTSKKTGTKRKRGYYRTYGSSLQGMGPIVITGRGGYYTDKLASGASAAWRGLKRITPQGTFNRLGQAAGGAMFGKPGATIGGWLGTGVSNILGFGDYAIRKNDLMMLEEGVPVPTFQDMNQGILVCHREYIGDITQSTAFTLTSYSINPGDSKTFPWLSQLAPNFDQYELLGCLFQFRSTASDFGTTTNAAMGTVILATEYDTVDSTYGSKLEMENAQYSMSGKPSHDILHPIECDPSLVGPTGLKYIRTGPVPSGKDIRLYDHGTFQIATTGMPAATGTIGELWVTYKVALYKPQINLGSSLKFDTFSGTSGVSSGQPFPTTAGANNSLNCTVTNSLITFPATVLAGQYILVNGWAVGATTGGQQVSGQTATNCTIVSQQTCPAAAASLDRVFYTYILKIGSGTATLAVNSTVPGTLTEVRLIITQIDTDFTF